MQITAKAFGQQCQMLAGLGRGHVLLPHLLVDGEFLGEEEPDLFGEPQQVAESAAERREHAVDVSLVVGGVGYQPGGVELPAALGEDRQGQLAALGRPEPFQMLGVDKIELVVVESCWTAIDFLEAELLDQLVAGQHLVAASPDGPAEQRQVVA